MWSEAEIELVLNAAHRDPFAVLGPHVDADGVCWLRVFVPGARSIHAVDAMAGVDLAGLTQRHPDGFFEGVLPQPGAGSYRLRVGWQDGGESVIDDPYRFPPMLGELDAWLIAEGTHQRPFEVLGAAPCTVLATPGTRFSVWAPNASRVSVVGDFNHWDGRRHAMRLRRECGVWEIFLPGVGVGARYKYEIHDRDGQLLPLKADPYALAAELRPATASVVALLAPVIAPSEARRHANALGAPMSIYEVHLGSWRHVPADERTQATPFPDWDRLAASLVPYAREMGFTHLELLPISEHPFDGSWGYQPIGLYAPSARFGDPAGFGRFVKRCHAEGLGVLLDWVPAHFPSDPHGLANFDGTHLYDHADPREGFHQDWNTLIYNFGRAEVRNFLIGNALYWLERFGVDGLRVDAVASMLYRDYSRPAGQWVPNIHGGRENLEAIDFVQRLNEAVGVQCPYAVMMAEESTAFPAVSRPVWSGGLGFHFKWNMGWMNDTLAYMARDPIHRCYHHSELTFGLIYAFTENFVLPISHDEVVHGKGSLLSKMPGDRWQQFANLRAYAGFMFGHPGKKLLFMGCEFAQVREWNHDAEIDWHLLDDAAHSGVQRLVGDLNRLYTATPALYERDFDSLGFEWIEPADSQRSVLSFLRRGEQPGSLIVVVCNFTPTVHRGYRVGVPEAGVYRERLNTDSQHYGGSNVGTALGSLTAQAQPAHGRAWSLEMTVPPLATVFFEWTP